MEAEVRSHLEKLNFTLSDKEIDIYIALLRGGSQKANKIAKAAELNRATTYTVLKSLKEKGMVSISKRGGVKYFQAADPETLLHTLEEKERDFREILPRLEELKQSVFTHPDVEKFEGKEGLKTILKDWLNTGKNIIGLGSTGESLNSVIGHYFPQYIQKRVKKGIKIRILLRESEYARDLQKRDEERLRETRTIDCQKLTTGVYLYGDKASFLTFKQERPMGLVIDSPSIVKTLETMLEILWRNAEK